MTGEEGRDFGPSQCWKEIDATEQQQHCHSVTVRRPKLRAPFLCYVPPLTVYTVKYSRQTLLKSRKWFKQSF